MTAYMIADRTLMMSVLGAEGTKVKFQKLISHDIVFVHLTSADGWVTIGGIKLKHGDKRETVEYEALKYAFNKRHDRN